MILNPQNSNMEIPVTRIKKGLAILEWLENNDQTTLQRVLPSVSMESAEADQIEKLLKKLELLNKSQELISTILSQD